MAGMAAKKPQILWAVIALVALLGLDSIYWLLFFLWRSAAEPALNHFWLPRIYVWLVSCIITGTTWIALMIRAVRYRRASD